MGPYILQIIAADGWSAVYADKNHQGVPIARRRPLACWALVEDDDRYRSVDAMEGGESGADYSGGAVNFLGYTREGDGSDPARRRRRASGNGLFLRGSLAAPLRGLAGGGSANPGASKWRADRLPRPPLLEEPRLSVHEPSPMVAPFSWWPDLLLRLTWSSSIMDVRAAAFLQEL
jgi:hypothetical protein